MALKQRRVLLNIDLQEGFVKEGTRSVASTVSNIIRTNTFDLIIQTKWLNDYSSAFMSKLFYKGCLPGTDEDLVLSIPGAKVLERGTYSAADSRLDRLLYKDDIIYITGLETDACVLATCYGLFDKGYNFKVVSDAVGTNRSELQGPVLTLMRRSFGKDCLIQSNNLIF